jgi:hypothetical protein
LVRAFEPEEDVAYLDFFRGPSEERIARKFVKALRGAGERRRLEYDAAERVVVAFDERGNHAALHAPACAFSLLECCGSAIGRSSVSAWRLHYSDVCKELRPSSYDPDLIMVASGFVLFLAAMKLMALGSGIRD